MKNKIFFKLIKDNYIYIIFIIISLILISLYFINPNTPLCSLSLSLGTSIFGAIILTICFDKKQEKLINKKNRITFDNLYRDFKTHLTLYFRDFILLSYEYFNINDLFENLSNEEKLENIINTIKKLKNTVKLKNQKEYLNNISNKIIFLSNSFDTLHTNVFSNISNLLFNNTLSQKEIDNLIFFDSILFILKHGLTLDNLLKTNLTLFRGIKNFSLINIDLNYVFDQKEIKKIIKFKENIKKSNKG